ncbi:uncharacterized protein LOC117386582 [Periophthalmus magnuspinnatus]|uniref:uncharacterized protein LOC117386582 n=1 Tax=Periophthalmus magnuspinnatus TaxID=409849 RepID=UPI00145B868D|nr:uncharacterized protein LOC117386582 [Periophthalmus magnuspinnatus]
MIGLLVLAGVAIIVSILFCITKQKYSQQESKFQEASCADKAGKTSSQAITPRVNKEDSQTKLSTPQEERHLFNLSEKVKNAKREREISEKRSPLIINHLDHYGRSFSLKRVDACHIKGWSVQIEVGNDEALIFKFETFCLPQNNDIVTIWTEGCCPPDADKRYNQEWKNQAPWNTGEIAFVSLYNKSNELTDRICEWMCFDPPI